MVFVIGSMMLGANAFSVIPGRAPSSSLRMSDSGSVEQIEFKIYPDGRVEETVRGIKGNNCHKVTEKINESLGEVIASAPTEELYEQELVIDQTVKNTQSGSGWDGGSTW